MHCCQFDPSASVFGWGPRANMQQVLIIEGLEFRSNQLSQNGFPKQFPLDIPFCENGNSFSSAPYKFGNWWSLLSYTGNHVTHSYLHKGVLSVLLLVVEPLKLLLQTHGVHQSCREGSGGVLLPLPLSHATAMIFYPPKKDRWRWLLQRSPARSAS